MRLILCFGLTVFLVNCNKSIESTSDGFRKDLLIAKLDSLGEEYIDYLRKDGSIGDTCYLNVEQESNINKNLASFNFYVSSRPYLGGSIPSTYKIVQGDNKKYDVIFVYLDNFKEDSLQSIERLKKVNLLKDSSDPLFDTNSVNDFLYWKCTVCLKNSNNFRIMRSDSVMLIDKLLNGCD